MMIPSVFTLLLLYQFTGIVNCAYVNISLSATNVRVNGSLQITLVDMNPACCKVVENVLLISVLSDGFEQTLADYSRLNAFKLHATLPLSYRGRLYTSGDNVTISPVAFGDEKMKYYMRYEYYDGVLLFHVDSRRLELQTVYAVPVIDSAPLKQVTDVNMGEPTLIVCSVKSRPASNITWSYDAEITGNGSQNVQKSGEYYYITTGTFNVTNPSKLMDGKKVRCNATHQFGSPVVQSTTLHIQYKPESIQFTSSALKPVNGKNVALNCSSTGVPTPKYRIYKIIHGNGTLIADSTTGIHTISSINYVNYGGYNATVRCVPYNILGYGPTKVLHLDIQVKPLLVTPSHLKVKRGANVAFSCKILAANPATNVTWTGPSKQAIQHSNGVVKIDNIATNQLGIYSCHANNSVGKTTKTVTLSFGGVGTILSSKVGTIGSVILGLAIVIMISDI